MANPWATAPPMFPDHEKGATMPVTDHSSPRVGHATGPESFDDFRCLQLHDVRRRAEEAEARPSTDGPGDLPCARAAWRRLYRDMRRADAATVAHLKRHEVEQHASRLGYGYFRIRVSGRGAFMPLPR
jgi:hypothetical protein